MTNRTVYLDANATEPLRPEAREAMVAALDTLGNPASVHGPGRAARRILEDARETIAGLFGSKPADVVFTSGGTEADVLAVNALGYERTTIFGATEHDAIRRAPSVGFILPVHSNGVADTAALETFLEEEERQSLVCIMLANNETGTINPIDTILPICQRHGARLHIDAVQAAGRMPVRLDQLGANSLAISSHKLGGPAGAGALLLNNVHKFGPPLLRGGGQEGGRRGGTPAVAVIAGFAAAAKAAVAQLDNMKRIAALRDRAEAAAIAAGAEVYGNILERIPNTTCLRMPGVKAAQQVIALDLENIAVSFGAACSSGKSRVQPCAAIHADPLAGGRRSHPHLTALEHDRGGYRRFLRHLSAGDGAAAPSSSEAGRRPKGRTDLRPNLAPNPPVPLARTDADA